MGNYDVRALSPPEAKGRWGRLLLRKKEHDLAWTLARKEAQLRRAEGQSTDEAWLDKAAEELAKRWVTEYEKDPSLGPVGDYKEIVATQREKLRKRLEETVASSRTAIERAKELGAGTRSKAPPLPAAATGLPYDVTGTPEEAAEIATWQRKAGVNVPPIDPQDIRKNMAFHETMLGLAPDIEKIRRGYASELIDAIGLTPDQVLSATQGKGITLTKAQIQNYVPQMGVHYGEKGPPSVEQLYRDVNRIQRVIGPPSKIKGSLWGLVMHGLTGPARAVTSAKAGALKELQELTADVPLETSAASAGESAAQKLYGPAATAVLGPAGVAAPLIGHGLTALGAPTGLEKTRYVGVPLKEAAQRLARDPKKLLDVGKAMALYARAGLETEDPEALTDISALLKITKNAYENEATRLVEQQMGPRPVFEPGKYTPEDVKRKLAWDDAVGKLTAQFMSRDIGELEMNNPNLAELVHDALLDPYNLVGTGAITTAVNRVPGGAKLLAKAGKAKNAALLALEENPLTRGFIYKPHLGVLNRAASPNIQAAAAITRAAEEQVVGRFVEPLVEKLQSKEMKNLLSLSDAQQLQLAEIANFYESGQDVSRVVSGLHPKARAAWEFARTELEPLHRRVMQESGVGQQMTPWGKVFSAPEMEHYGMPRQMTNEGEALRAAKEEAPFGMTPPPRPASVVPGAAHERVGGQDPFMNFGKQWEYAYKDLIAKVSRGGKAKLLAEQLPTVGGMEVLPVGTQALSGASYRAERAAKEATSARVELANAKSKLQDITDRGSTAQKDADELLAQVKNVQARTQQLRLSETQRAKAQKDLDGVVTGMQADPGEVEERLAQLNALDPDAKWVSLSVDPELKKFFVQHGLEPGTELHKTHVLMPAAIAHDLQLTRAVLPEYAREMLHAGEDGWLKLNRAITRPLNRVWRVMHTMLNPVFAPRNILSVPPLAYNAAGLMGLSPKLHFTAAGTAFWAALAGSKRARSLPFGFAPLGWKGPPTTIGEQIGHVLDFGGAGQLSARASLGARAYGPLDWPSRAVEKVARFGDIPYLRGVSLANQAAGSELYQHLTGYLLFLKENTPAGRAMAWDLQSKWFGNYRRLGTIEQHYMREGFAFYPWMQFMFPLYLKAFLQHPARLANPARMREQLEAAYGGQAPFTDISSWQQNMALTTAPPQFQPKRLREHLADIAAAHGGEIPAPGTYEFTMMAISDIHMMGLPYVVPFARLLGDKTILDRRGTFAETLGPIAKFALEGISSLNFDTMEPFEGGFAPLPLQVLMGEEDGLQFWQKLRNSATGRFAWGFVDRPSSSLSAAYKLYFENGAPNAALNLALSCKVARDFGLWNLALGAISGKGDLGVGSLYTPAVGFYATDPERERSFKLDASEKALEDAFKLKRPLL